MKLNNLFKLALALVICANTLDGMSQTIINKGANIVVGSNAYLIGHHYVNDKGTNNGTISIDGTITLSGNWTNNADNNVFISDDTPEGTVILKSDNEQLIGGVSPSNFENLTIESGTKKLMVNNNQVNGTLASTNAILDLNKQKIIVNNKSTDAIAFSGGYIKSETSDTYGEVQWNIANNTGEYKIPFANNTGEDLEVIFNAKSMDNNTGAVVFATYPTTDGASDPLPIGVAAPYTKKAERIADRYWEVNPINYGSVSYDLTFNYTPEDIDATENPKIREPKLKMVTYSPNSSNSNKWKGMKAAGTQSGTQVKADALTVINKWWTLVDAESKYYIPNVITPNSDGKNDLFGVTKPDDEMTDGRKDLGFEGEIASVDAKIFNRWGKIIKKWEGTGDDETAYGSTTGGVVLGGTWDGKNEGGKVVADGTYFWVFDIVDDEGETHNFQGTINVYNNK